MNVFIELFRGPPMTAEQDIARDERVRAAAQEMLDVLKAIRNMIDAPHFSADRKYRIRDMADEVIAKAEGK